MMDFKKVLKSTWGFSLIEMMVVVAIIAVLSMIAVPSYQSFQARARQKEGFNQLSTFYAAAQATRAEFGLYPGNLVATGYAPVGQLNYRLRSNDNPNDLDGANGFNNDDTCWRTAAACDCGGGCPNYKTWNEMPVGAAGTLGVASVAAIACPMGALDTQNDSFIVGVSGWISPSAANQDTYYMDELKTIEMCSDGLK